MRLDAALRKLAEDSLIATMPEGLATKFKAAATVRAVPRKSVVARQDGPADKVIIPVDAPLRLVTRNETGTTTTQLSPRRALNLAEVLVGGRWSYSAFADVDMHVVEVDASVLREILDEAPVYGRYLRRITHVRALRDAAAALRGAGLRPRSVQRLFSALEERSVTTGTFATDEAELAWVIVERGELSLLRDEGVELVELTALGPGEFYGGGAALGRATPLRMRARETSSIFVIDAASLGALCTEDRDLGRVLRLEHPEVQRRVRKAFTESGEAFTDVMFGEAAAAFADEATADAATVDVSRARRLSAEIVPVIAAEPRIFGRPWTPSPVRARRLDGARCSLPEDTGAAALASLLKFYDRPVAYSHVRRALAHRTPPSLLDLAHVAERQGFITHAAKLAHPRKLRQLRGPFLLLLGQQFVVVHEVGRRSIRVFDPLGGLREIRLRELVPVWSGTTLIVRDMRPFMQDLTRTASPEQPRADATSAAKPAVKGKRSTYLRLFADVRGALIAALIVAVAVLVLSIVSPRLNGLVVDQVLAYGDLDLLTVIAIGLVLIHVSTFLLTGFRDLCVAYLGGVIEHRLSSITLRHTLGVALEAHGDDRVGSALSRLDELNGVRASLSSDVLQIVLQIAQALVFLILVLAYSVKLGLILLCALPISVVIIRIGGKRYRARYLELFDETARMQSQTTEQVEQVATIKALGGGAASQRRWEQTLVGKVAIERRLSRVRVWVNVSLKLVEEVVKIAAMYFGIRLVLGGDLSPGTLIAVTQYVLGALGPLMGLASKLDELEQVGISLRKLDQLFEHPLEDEETGGIRSDLVFEGAIAAHDVGFAYGDGPPVIRGLTFEIKPGQTVAIVGRSGSGKTTLAKLLHGALRPSSGELVFDDQDSRSLPLPAIRRNVGIVLQESQLFAGTILENIAYGDDRPDVERVREAARLAAAHEFITAFPNKYATYLAEGGLGLSGGQRQRICIARALYRSPKILIMDEATSALDAESERAIMANMRDILRGRTGIVIAHRLTTVKHADRILVIDQGELVEDGTHDELVAKRGLYHALFGQQFHQA